MNTLEGWRIEQDQFDRKWYAVDAHGDTRGGPFPTPLAGREWIEEFRGTLTKLRDANERSDNA